MKRGEIWWVNIEPHVGGEVSKQRPVVIIIHSSSNASDATVVYQWQRQASGEAEWVDIAGATASTYTVVTPVTVGDKVRLQVTGTIPYTGTVAS